jgi:ubiquinone/menaquinone biosynthesis C-methylase UbiE
MDIIDANVRMHTAASTDYREFEPHYRKENIENVRGYVKMLHTKTQGKSLLDVGCGMGFMIDIAKEYFSYIRGIDVTPAMLEKVDLTSKNNCDIQVSLSKCERMPYENDSFDACTSYAVLHHLSDLDAVFREMYRVLKPGGMLFTGLDPNFYFWEAFSKLDGKLEYSAPIKRELAAVLHKDTELEEKYKLPKEVIDAAEHYKHIDNGFRPEVLERQLAKAGFSRFEVQHVWYVGQGKIVNDKSLAQYAPTIDAYLTEMMPLTKHLYKYLNIIAVK